MNPNCANFILSGAFGRELCSTKVVNPRPSNERQGPVLRFGPTTDYEITETENGEEALIATAQQRPELILMDYPTADRGRS